MNRRELLKAIAVSPLAVALGWKHKEAPTVALPPLGDWEVTESLHRAAECTYQTRHMPTIGQQITFQCGHDHLFTGRVVSFTQTSGGAYEVHASGEPPPVVTDLDVLYGRYLRGF